MEWERWSADSGTPLSLEPTVGRGILRKARL